MLPKVFKIIILIPICVGDILPNPVQKFPNNQASSSVSFHRQDVPLTYQYSALHPQDSTTKNEYKPLNYQESQNQNPINFRSIQYAPLNKRLELLSHNAKSNKGYFYNREKLLDPTKFALDGTPAPNIRKPLEPRVEELPSVLPSVDNIHHLRGHSQLANLDYFPGHNIEVLRSVNRFPAHNAVYRSYTDRNPTNVDRQNKFEYLNQQPIHPSQKENDYTTNFRIHVESKETTTKITPTTSTTASTTTTHTIPKIYEVPYKPPKQYYIPKPIKYVVEKPIAAEKAPYTKMHSLLLNVARAYNLAMTSHKNHHSGTNPNLLAQIQNFGVVGEKYNHKPRMKVPGLSQLNVPYTDKKTILYPVQKNVHYAV